MKSKLATLIPITIMLGLLAWLLLSLLLPVVDQLHRVLAP